MVSIHVYVSYILVSYIIKFTLTLHNDLKNYMLNKDFLRLKNKIEIYKVLIKVFKYCFVSILFHPVSWNRTPYFLHFLLQHFCLTTNGFSYLARNAFVIAEQAK